MHKVTNNAINFYLLGRDFKPLRKKKNNNKNCALKLISYKINWSEKWNHTPEKKRRVCDIWWSYFLSPGSYQKMQHEDLMAA